MESKGPRVFFVAHLLTYKSLSGHFIPVLQLKTGRFLAMLPGMFFLMRTEREILNGAANECPAGGDRKW